MKLDVLLADVVRKASEPHAVTIWEPGAKNLQGMCAISSLALYKGLNEVSIPVQFKMGYLPSGISHCWVETDKVIDVTATQFCRHEAVYITAPDKAKLKVPGSSHWFNYYGFEPIPDWQIRLEVWDTMSPYKGPGKIAHEAILEKVYSFLSAPP